MAAKGAEQRNPPIGKFIDVRGVRLHYIERGQGPAVVLLHGNTVMLQDYILSGVLDGAALRCRVIAFDRPGFGYSTRPRNRIWTPVAQAELIHEALRRMGVDRAVVVGHSWGTLVAVALALNHREVVRALVLLSGFYFPRFRFDVLMASPPAIPVLGDVLRYTISPILQGLMLPLILRQMFGPPPVPQRFKKEFPLSMILRPWQIRATAAEAALMVPAAMGLQPRYSELSMPISIIAGTSDRVVTTGRQSARLHERFADIPISDGRGRWPYGAPRCARPCPCCHLQGYAIETGTGPFIEEGCESPSDEHALGSVVRLAAPFALIAAWASD